MERVSNGKVSNVFLNSLLPAGSPTGLEEEEGKGCSWLMKRFSLLDVKQLVLVVRPTE